MKRIILILMSVITLSAYSQNHLESGVKSAGRIDFKDDESESIVYNTSISFPTDCSATYKFTQDWNDGFVEKVNTYEVKWYWKDISVIKVDKVLNVLELDTDSKVIETNTDVNSQEVIKNNKQSDIGIYFKNIDDALKAADWALTKIANCGGKAVIVK